MERGELAKTWDEFWETGLWAAPLSKAVEGLTATQAAWRPEGVQGERHSIWQVVNHLVFWREIAVRRTRGKGGTVAGEVEKRNWESPREVTEEAWAAARGRLAESQKQVRATIEEPGLPLDQVAYLVPHDCYHLGQIMQMRGMLGMKVIE